MADEYIHKPSIGSIEACRSEHELIKRLLDAIYERGDIKGYQSLIIKSQSEAVGNWILSDFNRITNRRFPFLFLAIEYKEKRENLDEIVKRGYEPLKN